MRVQPQMTQIFAETMQRRISREALESVAWQCSRNRFSRETAGRTTELTEITEGLILAPDLPGTTVTARVNRFRFAARRTGLLSVCSAFSVVPDRRF